MRERREASARNWLRDRPGHTIGVTKPARSERRRVSKKKSKAAKVSRRANR